MGGSLPGTGPDLFRRKAELLIASSEFLELCDANLVSFRSASGSPILRSSAIACRMRIRSQLVTIFFSQCPDLAA